MARVGVCRFVGVIWHPGRLERWSGALVAMTVGEATGERCNDASAVAPPVAGGGGTQPDRWWIGLLMRRKKKHIN